MKRLTILALVLLAGCQKLDLDKPAPTAAARQEQVAKTLTAAGITPADIAAYLLPRGWTILPANIPKPHWRPAQPGQHPISYYVCDLRVATGDTSLAVYFPQTAGPWAMWVKAVDSQGVSGQFSLVGWSDNGTGSNALPGVRP